MSVVRHINDISRETQNQFINEGRKTLQKNRFFQFIDLVMNDQNTRQYIDEFFSDWDDIKTSVMIMKTYQVVEQELRSYEESSGNQMSNERRRLLLVSLVKEMMTNGECRQELIRNMNQFMEGDYHNCRALVRSKDKSLACQ